MGTPPAATSAASTSAATAVAQWTGTKERTTRLSDRRRTSRRRRVPTGRGGGRRSGVLQRQVIDAVNFGELGLDAGNVLLTSLNQEPLEGSRHVSFRVDARVRVPYAGLDAMMGYARAVLGDELRQLRWTRLDGYPEDYSIDEPTIEAGRLYATVHTTLRLTVTVPAFEEDLLEATARDLLDLDLKLLRRVEPDRTRIMSWDDDVTSWDDYLVDVDFDDVAWPTVLG